MAPVPLKMAARARTLPLPRWRPLAGLKGRKPHLRWRTPSSHHVVAQNGCRKQRLPCRQVNRPTERSRLTLYSKTIGRSPRLKGRPGRRRRIPRERPRAVLCRDKRECSMPVRIRVAHTVMTVAPGQQRQPRNKMSPAPFCAAAEQALLQIDRSRYLPHCGGISGTQSEVREYEPLRKYQLQNDKTTDLMLFEKLHLKLDWSGLAVEPGFIRPRIV
ncbi:Hypothetical predicted protein [Podarcis lilfordi]|uniref:Uncharacterized protein n=1 Tax=Podarcis lilfordi TaxID=74358 RepID=A0AA35KEX9_9SAUR|nr:Hypothetical predicted protein [Podarcis lilfordi]